MTEVTLNAADRLATGSADVDASAARRGNGGTASGKLRPLLKGVRRAVTRALDSSGITDGIRRLTGRRHVILTFHRIYRDGEGPDEFTSCPHHHVETFRRAVEYCAERFRIVSLRELVAERACSRPLVAITFDDGWRDNYDLALPVLRAYDAPATIFVVTGRIGASAPFWQRYVSQAFRDAQCSPERAETLRRVLRLPVATALSPTLFGDTIRAWKRLSACELGDRVAELSETCGVELETERLFLNRAEIGEMAACGVEFGSHTHTHPILTREPANVVDAELARSRDELSQITGATVDTLAYPNGDCSPSVVERARVAGFRIGCTTVCGRVSWRDDPMTLRRIEPNWQDPVSESASFDLG